MFGNVILHQEFEDLRGIQLENEDEALAKVLKMSKPEDSPTPSSLVQVSFEYPELPTFSIHSRFYKFWS